MRMRAIYNNTALTLICVELLGGTGGAGGVDVADGAGGE